LLSLNHPHVKTTATEAYSPNVELCRETLLPLGINFRETGNYENLPFENNSFNIVINRHGTLHVPELRRILKPGGIFITEQVGEQNDYKLRQLLLPGCQLPFPGWNLNNCVSNFEQNNFVVLKSNEPFCPIEFYDIGALVWFARIVEWEFFDFSVAKYFDRLCFAQKLLEEKGAVSGSIHRFFIVAQLTN